jgi:Flp pilus assembly protein TadG
MALLAPVLLLVLIGALDLGRLYIYQTRVNSALKEGVVLGLYQPNLGAIQGRAFREVTDPGALASASDDRYLLGNPGVDFIIDTYKLYPSTGTTSVLNCMDSGNVRCTNPAPGDTLEVSGYYIFKPLTSELVRFLPHEARVRRTVRAVY